MKTIAYCTECASIIFIHTHTFTVDVTKSFEWMGNSPTDREHTPADEEFRDGTSYNICPQCNCSDAIIQLHITEVVAEVLLEAKKEHDSISLVLTEAELDGSYFMDATRLKKEILRQSL